jgi:hypothetical protein
MAATQYIPGVCNIGKVEIASRRRIGVISTVIAVIMAVLFFVLPVPSIVRILLFLPVFAAASAFIQVRSHFCAGFGMTGLFNFGDELGKTDTAQQAEWRAKDKKRALTIVAEAVAIGLVVTVIAVFV